MKTNYFLIILLALLFTVSCGDSEEKKTKYYSYSGEKLTLHLNGDEIVGKIIDIQTIDDSVAEIKLQNIIPGEPVVVVNTSLKSKSGEDTSFSFSGENSTPNRKIRIDGDMGNILNLSITFEITSPLKGEWTPTLFDEEENTFPFEIYAVHSSTKEMVNMYGVLNQSEPIPLSEFTTLMKGVGGLLFSLVFNVAIDLKTNANLVAQWESPMGFEGITPGISKEGIVKYNVVNQQVFITLPIDELLGSLLSASFPTKVTGSSPIESIIQMLTTGIPLDLTFVNDNKIMISIDQEMMTPFLDLMAILLIPKLGEIVFPAEISSMVGITNENMPLFAAEFIRLIKECDQFELRLYLDRIQ